MKTKVYIKDHLGSNRMVVNSIGTINQHSIYYALGGNTALSSGQEYQQYKYTDKEYDPMHGLNQYDFGARNYDPAIGRFTSVDPLAEKYYHMTPYSYCGGDPVNAVDPDGRDWYSFNGTYKWYGVTDENYIDKEGNKWTNVGHTYTDKKTNIYYSLFGQIYNLSDKDFKGVRFIDDAIINYAKYESSIDKNASGGGETNTAPTENISRTYSFSGKSTKLHDYNAHFLHYGGSSQLTMLHVVNKPEMSIIHGVDVIRYISLTGLFGIDYIGMGFNFRNDSNADLIIGVFKPDEIAEKNESFYRKLVNHYKNEK